MNNNKYKEALRRLLYCLDYTEGWPHITVSVGHNSWISGGVDDETKEAIRYAEKCLEADYER